MTSARSSLLLLATDFPPARGGIQTLTWEIYSRLADLVQLAVAPAATEATLAAALPVVRARHACGPGWWLPAYLRDAAGILRRRRQPPCLLHCNHLFAGYAGWWLRRRLGLPYIVWAHGEEITRVRFPALARASLGEAMAILTNSDFTAEQVRRRLSGRPIPPIHKITLGAPNAWLQLPPATSSTAHPATILTVARLCARDRYKGVDTSLRAMALLRQRGIEVRYRIAGDGDDRPYLATLAQRLGVAERVEFLGPVAPERLMAAYDEADIFLLCSREEMTPRGLGFEGFGIAALEAGARGKPVIAGRSGGIPDAVLDGVTGLLVDPLSPGAVAEGLAKLLHDPELRARFGENGRARVRDHANWENAASQVRALHLQWMAQPDRMR